MTAGYSGTPLATKLGCTPGSRVLLDGAPDDVELEAAGAEVHRRRGRSPYDVGVLFAPNHRRLASRWAVLHEAVAPAARLWVAWPKKASGEQTDLDENVVRAYGLAHGRVDVKVCAIDAIWSGLCFVVRVRDR